MTKGNTVQRSIAMYILDNRSPLKVADTSKTRRARLSDGSVLSVHDQGKYSATQYCEVYPRQPHALKSRRYEQDKAREAFRWECTKRT